MSPLTVREIHEALERHAPELTLSHQPIGGFQYPSHRTREILTVGCLRIPKRGELPFEGLIVAIPSRIPSRKTQHYLVTGER